MNTYGERKLTLVKGDGIYLWDDNGRRYLDALSGIAVSGLGHNHPKLVAAIKQQAETLIHVSNLYNIQPQEELAELLCAQSGMEKVFFSNSGAEANEAAIKIARKYGHEIGIDEPVIITMNGSFHGRTMATLSATGNPKVKAGFSPLVSGFTHVDYNDVEAIEQLNDPNIVAILVEPVQGEGGVHVPAGDYLNQLRTLCDKNGWLLMLDEIQTGNGRTGKYFAYQHNDILPDVVTTAKGLGNGLPVGACLAQGKAGSILQPGNQWGAT
jgi:acetylornithine aminotransferase